MNQVIESYTTADRKEAIAIWNAVVEDGMAFPQEDVLTEETGEAFFQSQSFTGIAKDAATGEIVGLYILHPNNGWAVRSYLQRKLRRKKRTARKGHRRAVGTPLHGEGKRTGIPHFAI